MNKPIFINSKIESLIEENSICVIELTRDDTDQYVIIKRPLNDKDKTESFNNNDFKLFISAGSAWKNFIGWNSYFGQFILKDEKDFLCLGVETAFPHKNGAYLANKTYVINYPINNSLSELFFENFNTTFDVNMSSKIVEVKMDEYHDFIATEKNILNHSISCLLNGVRVNFRTLLLSESNLIQMSKLKMPIIIGYNMDSKIIFTGEGVSVFNKLKKKHSLSIFHQIWEKILAMLRSILR